MARPGRLTAKIKELEADNDRLRVMLSNSNQPCFYCGLSKRWMSKCKHGFPGCARADDMVRDLQGPAD